MFKFPAKMAGLKTFTMVLAVVLLSMAFSGKMAAAVEHHVVGDDKGWDLSSDLGAWAAARVFKVGDNIWFDNTASQESLVELESIDEFSSCDLTNPIKMYTGEDITKVSLDGEGSRYFVSGKPGSCKKGLKLHINVHPEKDETSKEDGSPSEYRDVTPEEKNDINPRGSFQRRDAHDVPEPPPSPTPKPKPPHIAPPPGFDPDVGPDSPPEPFDPDVGPGSPPEPYYPPPTPTPSSSTLFNGHFVAMVAAACWVGRYLI